MVNWGKKKIFFYKLMFLSNVYYILTDRLFEQIFLNCVQINILLSVKKVLKVFLGYNIKINYYLQRLVSTIDFHRVTKKQ